MRSVLTTDPDPPFSALRVRVELEIPSDVRCIERVVELVAQQCQYLEYNPRQIALNVPVALTEALSNAILRGNHEDPGKNVQVRAEVTREQLVVEVADEGDGFDLDECTLDPTVGEALMREDGRGLFLMRRLMDRIERFYNHRNIVRMTMRRHD
ncbi:MAG: ATP-binding protein [Gemmatimonadaceae bacterium]